MEACIPSGAADRVDFRFASVSRNVAEPHQESNLNRRCRYLRRVAYVAAAILAFVLLEGCYYMQAIGGQMEIMRKRRPVDEVIGDEATDDSTRERLIMVQQARQFAIDELMLPENGSYGSYADLKRDYVVWNVFAAPEFSLTPVTWCYPVAGCVAYRGYFSQEKAHKFADKLVEDGLDVIVGGVAAYSTLGRFDDPVLNTMMNWTDIYLVETLFHELAHQKLYVKGDSAFNESYATAVAEIGIERWFQVRQLPDDFSDVVDTRVLQANVRKLVLDVRDELDDLYSSTLDENEMRARKKTILDSLSQAAQRAIDSSGVDTANWLAAPLNNARLVSLGLYEGNLSAFQVIMSDCEKQLDCFHRESAALAELEHEQRQTRLAELHSRSDQINLTPRPGAER